MRILQATPRTLAHPIRLSPRCDCRAAPFLGRDVAHCLRQFPAVAADVLDDTGALAILPRRQRFHDTCALFPRASEGRINVGHAHLDYVRHTVSARCDSIGTHLGHDHGTI